MRWTESSWRGRTNYECSGTQAGSPCQFKTLDKGEMLAHQRKHHRMADPLAGFTFASPQAETVAREAGLEARQLERITPSGADGAYTVADVKNAARSTSTPE